MCVSLSTLFVMECGNRGMTTFPISADAKGSLDDGAINCCCVDFLDNDGIMAIRIAVSVFEL
jgi:hypothetical protein